MLVLPSDIMALLVPFAPLFSSRIWRHVPLMVAGAILAPGRRMVSRQDAWYAKALPTFGDALTLVRRRLWTQTIFQTSLWTGEGEKVPCVLLNHLADLLCYAA